MPSKTESLVSAAADYCRIAEDIFERLAFTENPGIMGLVEQQREALARLKLTLDEFTQ